PASGGLIYCRIGVKRAALRGALRNAENLSQLGGGEPFPVMQLDRNLEIDGDLLQGAEEQALLLELDGARRGRAPEVDHRHGAHVHVLSLLALEETEELVASDREQVRPEARLLAETLLRLHAGQKRALDQVVDVVIGLVVEEAVQGVEVAAKQCVAGNPIT